MALWQRLWLLFTVIWVVVASLNIVTILAFSDEVEHGKALLPAAFGIVVPAAAYCFGWTWNRLRRRKK